MPSPRCFEAPPPTRARAGWPPPSLSSRGAAVRRGSLVALCAVGRALLPSVLLVELDGTLPELQDWLRASASQDADDGCRQLAVACHAIYGNAVRAEMRLTEEELAP